MKVLVMAYFSKDALEVCLEMMKSLCKISPEDIIVANLNAEKSLEDYLISQSQYRYILAEEGDTYGAVLNTVMSEFLEKGENLAIINEGMTFFPETFSLAEKYISEKGAGMIAFKKFSSEDGDFESLLNKIEKKNQLSALVGWGEEGMVLSGKMIDDCEKADESYASPISVLVDYLFNCGQKGYKFYKASDCIEYIFKEIPVEPYAYFQDKGRIRDKWGMNYFTYVPNMILMEIVPRDLDRDINVLEIGCDCGGNGSGVKEIYPDCHLYGMELNPNSAKIAATVYDEVVVGNAEEMELPFEGIKFDLVIFGDVLEHLRDPLRMLKKCHARMNNGGIVVTSIPNLMHFSVMRQLISGRFHYENDGLLDRTHIHFFTYYEILIMFKEAGFNVEGVLSSMVGKPSEEDEKLIETLLSLSTETERGMYETFQYNVRARK